MTHPSPTSGSVAATTPTGLVILPFFSNGSAELAALIASISESLSAFSNSRSRHSITALSNSAEVGACAK